jgi:hypothetical protein
MAELIQSSDLENKKKEQQAPQAPGVQPTASSTQPQNVSPVQTQQKQQVGAGPKQGTGFTNLQRILQAQGTAGQRLGQTITGGIQQAIGQAKTGLEQAGQQFQQQAQAGAIDIGQGAQQRIQNILANPQSASPEDLEFFQKYRDAQYAGPQGLQNLAGLQQQTQQAQGLSNLQKQQLLQRFVGGQPTYRSGQQRLDELLLGGSAGQQIRGQAREATALQRLLGQTEVGAEQQAQQLGSEANLAKEQTRQALGKSIGQFSSEAEQAAQTAQQAAQQQFEQAQARLARGEVTQQDLQSLGLDPSQSVFGLDLSQFALGPDKASAITALTPEKVAQAQALAKLSGQTGVGQDVLNQFSDLSQAGQYASKSPYSLDKEQFGKALQQKREEYAHTINPLITQNAQTSSDVKQMKTALDAMDNIAKGNPLQVDYGGINPMDAPGLKETARRYGATWSNIFGEYIDVDKLKRIMTQLAGQEQETSQKIENIRQQYGVAKTPTIV